MDYEKVFNGYFAERFSEEAQQRIYEDFVNDADENITFDETYINEYIEYQVDYYGTEERRIIDFLADYAHDNAVVNIKRYLEDKNYRTIVVRSFIWDLPDTGCVLENGNILIHNEYC